MASARTCLARDLELPGLPMMKRGILSSMHTTIMKMFSLSASLQATVWGSLISLTTRSWHLVNMTHPFNTCKSDATCSTVVIGVKTSQNELIVEIYFKSLVRAIGKVLRMKFSENTN